MTIDIPIENGPAELNVAGLTADLRAALAGVFAGLTAGEGLTLHFERAPTAEQRATAEAIIAAHDPAVLTPEQQAARDAEARTADAAQRARDIPQWALISEAEALAWAQTALMDPIASGRTALASADTLAKVKPIVAGMLDLMQIQNETIEKLIRMTLALRDAQWPTLAQED